MNFHQIRLIWLQNADIFSYLIKTNTHSSNIFFSFVVQTILESEFQSESIWKLLRNQNAVDNQIKTN